jgi:hypothetical protein
MKNLKNKLFPLLIAFSALSVSASAAFYSVSGLSKLFAGAAFAVIIMASSLEVAKLVIASLLYQYRKTLPLSLKIYLTLAAAVLVLITSMGIYGFLSAAYQETANKDKFVTQQVEVLETKKKLYENTRDNILKEKQSLAELKGTLSKGSTTQYTDKNGNLVIKSNNTAVKQIESANKSDDALTNKLDIANDSIFSLETQILEVKTNGESSSELGPLKYLSNLTGVSMDKIINWLLLIIIFVFDPLAIALVIAANFAFEQSKNENDMKLFSWIKEKINPKSNPKQEDSIIEPKIFPEEIILEDLQETSNEEKKIKLTEPTESLVEAVKEYQEFTKSSPNLDKRNQKIRQKFNKLDDDLTIKY